MLIPATEFTLLQIVDRAFSRRMWRIAGKIDRQVANILRSRNFQDSSRTWAFVTSLPTSLISNFFPTRFNTAASTWWARRIGVKHWTVLSKVLSTRTVEAEQALMQNESKVSSEAWSRFEIYWSKGTQGFGRSNEHEREDLYVRVLCRWRFECWYMASM